MINGSPGGTFSRALRTMQSGTNMHDSPDLLFYGRASPVCFFSIRIGEICREPVHSKFYDVHCVTQKKEAQPLSSSTASDGDEYSDALNSVLFGRFTPESHLQGNFSRAPRISLNAMSPLMMSTPKP